MDNHLLGKNFRQDQKKINQKLYEIEQELHV